MSDKYQLLLERAGRLYERHEAGRREPFNVFSVLRSTSDEVNLHSRFLHALLDYRKSSNTERRNLMDFLHSVAGKENFKDKGIKVERERYNIDILITNDARPKQAIVIENKIWAGDQSQQLQRYFKTLKKRGFCDIQLLYLTPDGHAPSEDSAGNLDYKTISYKDDLPPWLERCQKRAYDEPTLRESVAQYLWLVQKLTGTDFSGAYMNELKELWEAFETAIVKAQKQGIPEEEIFQFLEDMIDNRAADQAVKEMERTGEKPIPWEKVKKEAGL